jgi:hypothetical protein
VSDWNPVKIEDAIYSCVQRIETGVAKCDEAYRDYLKADHEFDVAEAKAYLSHERSPAHERKYRAVLDTITERDARDVAEALFKLMDKQMRALMAELDALRSIGASTRQAYSMAGRGEF